MITNLALENFKSFRCAELELGPLTLLIGPNASGKSNLRDAFRFLHAVGRGYLVAECLDGKYEAGVQVWSGIRGGSQEVQRRGKLGRRPPPNPPLTTVCSWKPTARLREASSAAAQDEEFAVALRLGEDVPVAVVFAAF